MCTRIRRRNPHAVKVSASWNGRPRPSPRSAWRHIVDGARVEMSEIREACVKRDRPNGAAAKAGIGQKAAGQFQTPRQTRIPRRSLLLSQKPIDVPGRDAVTSGIARPAFLGQPPIGRVFICPREGLANGSKTTHPAGFNCGIGIESNHLNRGPQLQPKGSMRPANAGRRPLLAPGLCTSVPVQAERTKCGTTRNRGSLGP